MTFTFTFEIDYKKLNDMLDSFLKSHNTELTAMVGKCLVLKTDEPSLPSPIISLPNPSSPPLESNKQEIDHRVDDRPLIGDNIPEDPFSNMFPNPNSQTTRYDDRNKKND